MEGLTLIGHMASLAGETNWHYFVKREASFGKLLHVGWLIQRSTCNFMKDDNTSKFQFPLPRLPARHITMPDFVDVQGYKHWWTKDSVFYLAGRPSKLHFFLMEGISHISGILIYWGIRHYTLIAVSSKAKSVCVTGWQCFTQCISHSGDWKQWTFVAKQFIICRLCYSQQKTTCAFDVVSCTESK